ncbi:MAG: hypothetical protein Q8M03_13730 [Legionella sp.]|nr:hypothetical protein [Legionella sp.]
MKRYNLALISLNNDLYTSLIAGKEKNSFGYCIGETSIPHITVCQFVCNSSHIESVWNIIRNKFENTMLNITFRLYSNITFDNRIYWLSLTPQEREALQNIFDIVSNHVESLRSDTYDPHLTLLNYQKNNLYINKEELENGVIISDDFYLSLGESDEIGQLTKIIFQSDEIPKQTLN